MIPHASITEIIQVSLAIFLTGWCAGAWTVYKMTRKPK